MLATPFPKIEHLWASFLQNLSSNSIPDIMKLSIAAAIMAFTSTSALAAPSPGPDPLEVVLSVDEVDLRIMGMNPTGNDHPTSGHPLNIVGITMIGESPRFMHNTVVNRDNKPNPLWPEGS